LIEKKLIGKTYKNKLNKHAMWEEQMQTKVLSNQTKKCCLCIKILEQSYLFAT
jgi:hypothetical protein